MCYFLKVAMWETEEKMNSKGYHTSCQVRMGCPKAPGKRFKERARVFCALHRQTQGNTKRLVFWMVSEENHKTNDVVVMCFHSLAWKLYQCFSQGVHFAILYLVLILHTCAPWAQTLRRMLNSEKLYEKVHQIELCKTELQNPNCRQK